MKDRGCRLTDEHNAFWPQSRSRLLHRAVLRQQSYKLDLFIQQWKSSLSENQTGPSKRGKDCFSEYPEIRWPCHFPLQGKFIFFSHFSVKFNYQVILND